MILLGIFRGTTRIITILHSISLSFFYHTIQHACLNKELFVESDDFKRWNNYCFANLQTIHLFAVFSFLRTCPKDAFVSSQ